MEHNGLWVFVSKKTYIGYRYEDSCVYTFEYTCTVWFYLFEIPVITVVGLESVDSTINWK